MLLLQYFDELTLQPQNAKKLKGLILELAVRGKLTKKWRIENPNTESATKLLTEIKAEKKRLIAAKEIRKEKPLPKIEAEEIPFGLPDNWIWCRMEEIIQLVSGRDLTTMEYFDEKIGIPYLTGASQIKNDRIILSRWTNVPKVISYKNDLLLSCKGTIGKTIINYLGEIHIARQIMALRNIHNMNIQYLQFFIDSFVLELIEKSKSLIPGISRKDVLEIPFPLPPLSEQKAIVKIVEQLFEEVEVLERLTEERLVIKQNYITAILNRLANENTEATWQQLLPQFEQFFDTEKSIKALRQTILQLAVQGKLTKDWRKTNPNTSSATELLQQIKTEKKRLIAEKVIKKEKVLPKIKAAEIPFDLPESWVWCRLGEVTNYGKSDKVNPEDADNYLWILELKDVEKSTSKLLKKVRFKDRNFRSSKSVFSKNDVIYGKLRPYLDKVIIADEDGVCTTEMIPIRSYLNLILPEYIRVYLKNPFFIDYANSSTHGMSLPRLGTDKAKVALVCLPPLSEQKAIVEKVATLLGYCDALEAAIAERGKRVEALMEGSLRAVLAV
jgi:type I restriction enzyme S subunit